MLNQVEKESLSELRDRIASGQPYRISYPLALAYLNSVGHENFVTQNKAVVDNPSYPQKKSSYLYPDDMAGFYVDNRDNIIKDLETYNSASSHSSAVSHVYDMFLQQYKGLIRDSDPKVSLDDIARIIFSDEKEHRHYEKVITVMVSAVVTNVSDYYREILIETKSSLTIDFIRNKVFEEMTADHIPEHMMGDSFFLIKKILRYSDKHLFIKNFNSYTGVKTNSVVLGVTYLTDPVAVYERYREDIIEWLEHTSLKNNQSSLGCLNEGFKRCDDKDDIHILARVIYGQDVKNEFYKSIIELIMGLLSEFAATRFQKYVNKEQFGG